MFLNKTFAYAISQEDLMLLRYNKKIGMYTTGKKDGIRKMRAIAFLTIDGLLSAYLQKDFIKVKSLLLVAAGTEEKFINLFGKSPLLQDRAKYFKGSFMIALIKSFPECAWQIKDFNFIPKNTYNFPEAINKLLSKIQAEEGLGNINTARKFLLKNNKAISILTKRKSYKADLKIAQQKALQRLFQHLDEQIFNKSPLKFAKKVIMLIHDDKTFRSNLGGTLLHRKYYQEELAKDPNFSINWRKALIYLLPACFIDENQIIEIGEQLGFSMKKIYRTYYHSQSAAR